MKHGSSSQRRDRSAPLVVRTPLQFFALAWDRVVKLIGLVLAASIAGAVGQRGQILVALLLVALLFTLLICFMRTQPKPPGPARVPARRSSAASSRRRKPG